MIAELFLILLLMVIFTDKIRNNSRILFLIFGLGLVVSHYSLTYFSLSALISAYVLLLIYYLYKWFMDVNGNDFHYYLKKLNNSGISIVLLLFLTLFMYLWYFYIAQGLAIKGFTDVLGRIFNEIGQNIGFLTHKIGFMVFYGLIIVLILTIGLLIFALFKFRKNISTGNSFRANLLHRMDPILKSFLKHHLLVGICIIILISLVFLVGNPQTWIVGTLRYLNFAMVFFTAMGLMISY